MPCIGYIKNNQPAKAIDLFHRIQKPDDVILNLLFNACAQLAWPQALSIVKRMISNPKRLSTDNQLLMHSLLDALIKCHDLTAAEN